MSECVRACMRARVSVCRHIAKLRQEMINGFSCNRVGMFLCHYATNVSNFGYEPIKFSSLKLIK